MKDIKIHFNKTDKEKPILVIEQQLVQAIVNIIQNAIDAVKEVSDPRIDITIKSLSNNQTLSIKDNGMGIDKEIMNHIFEPFFTTKEAGKGTGMGLSITYGIIKKFGGEIEVHSDNKSGTTFNLIYSNKMD